MRQVFSGVVEEYNAVVYPESYCVSGLAVVDLSANIRGHG